LLIIAIKSEVKNKYRFFCGGPFFPFPFPPAHPLLYIPQEKNYPTEVAYLSNIQNHTKCQDPKLLIPPQEIVQEPCLIAENM
jgi:hypothetical protein